ncbi:hypothetical protein PTSG_09965 [Salpingoeca rosetta]|uniref:Calponin-homology (CH) domain-containing protein n=1 Tax=Salpingoeca rosetta (strain ATCC 50818 / BSB-021) TaxID=946362 RepID=F2UNN8_SALR5|nr:uncharacterized protein PTSG_09965 [Salpingoeca rosetta]EGD79243.1 hypothetical protein PTSG_09965 [Salpingoeca rosetta]|eukprot:XP_004989328.1 hypothetical protein PTSG_09965 [Salpingoeca rosetta]
MMTAPVEEENKRLRRALAQAEREAQEADEDAQRFERAMRQAKQQLKEFQAQQRHTEDALRKELEETKATAEKQKQELRVCHARIDLLEERIFEANQAVERAEQDATEADQDAVMFEKHARLHEAKCHEATREIERLTQQVLRSAVPTSQRTRRLSPSTTARGGGGGVLGGGKKKTGKEAMLAWCQRITQPYKDVDITNFSSSFADGMAFITMMHHYFPSAIDLSKHSPSTQRENFEKAFKVADERGGVYPLLDVEDMVAMARPDALSVMTYVSQLHKQLAKRG